MLTKAKSFKSFFFQNIFVLTLTILGVISLVFLLRRHPAEFAANMLEAMFLFYGVITFLWTKGTKSPLVIIIRWSTFFYIVISFWYAVIHKGRNPLDFLLIYKCFIYLFILTFLSKKRLMSFKNVNRMFFIMLVLFTLKYLVMILVMHDDRPLMFMENNFELMFIYALYLIRYSVTRKKCFQLLALVGLITILSLSRSSLLMYSMLVLFVIYDSFKKTRVFFIPGAMLVLAGVIYYVFSQRSSSLEDIDRYRFMLVWWTNVVDWSVWQWLVGAERITPLSVESCSTMSYFVNLFSYNQDGTCYSVILHSFIFRIIYDHGILGLIFVVGTTYILLIKNNVKVLISLTFIAIVLLNGLSVSSFNNLFFAVSMLFLMSTNVEFPKKADERELDLDKKGLQRLSINR